jgi:hypothetical protein
LVARVGVGLLAADTLAAAVALCVSARAPRACVITQAITRKTRILDVNYNASNNELVSSGRSSVRGRSSGSGRSASGRVAGTGRRGSRRTHAAGHCCLQQCAPQQLDRLVV